MCSLIEGFLKLLLILTCHIPQLQEFLESSKDTKEMALGLLGVPDKRVAYYEKMPEFNRWLLEAQERTSS
jgi:hypothetical protein